jgi:hypothetical protein
MTDLQNEYEKKSILRFFLVTSCRLLRFKTLGSARLSSRSVISKPIVAFKTFDLMTVNVDFCRGVKADGGTDE